MSKIICEVCGTSYPETSTQCPICGSVHAGDAVSVNGKTEESENAGEYTYVKGGRFSKANVRKRNKGVHVATTSSKKKKPQNNDTEKKDTSDTPQKTKDNKGLVITIFVLILAIIAVMGYIVVKFLLPPKSGNDQVNPSDNQNPVIDVLEKKCTDVVLDASELLLEEAGQTVKLCAIVLPADTSDTISFTSADDTVATVAPNGVITAVSRGETVITVTCGSIEVKCTVICNIIPDEAKDFRLNRQQITFESEGSIWQVYSGDIPVENITWTSDDENIAIIEDGKITAVGEGYTLVHGEYLGNKQTCEIMCAFETDDNTGHEGNGGVTEDEGGSDNSADKEYHLDNLYSVFDTDVTINVGDFFPLRLVDEDGNEVDATWYVTEEGVCKVDGGDVTAIGSGETYVVAVYDGQEYRCRVCVY